MNFVSYSDTLGIQLNCFSRPHTEQNKKTLLAPYQEGEGPTTKATQLTGKVPFLPPQHHSPGNEWGESTVVPGSETCANIKCPVFVATLNSQVCVFE